MILKNKKTKRILVFLCVIITAVIFSGLSYSRYKNSKPVVLNTQRKFFDIQEVDSIPLSFEPSYLAISKDKILVKKANSSETILIDLQGHVLSKLTLPNSGRKNSAIVAIGQTDSLIFAGDGNYGKIYLKSNTAQSFDSIKTMYNYSKALFIDDGFILQYSGIGKFRDKLRFAKCSLSGQVTDFVALNYLFGKIDQSGTTRAGFLTSNGKLNFFVSYLTNDILAFDNQGVIIFNKEAIYSVRKPEAISEGNFSTIGVSVITTSSIAADDNSIFILSNIGDKKHSGHRIVDMYSVKDGAYLKSFVAPLYRQNHPIDIYSDSNFLYFSYNGIIKKINKPRVD